ncbi:uncharacterized protein LOC126677337 [Mercurialis annua]|uniref:uncharacterized protein LOC126677337 n=1 Tax=Mercurialis annua TaxID=3986 RepID=UPI0021609A6C|nr:uncharacterized protein LOC126677337 [Mercurialis annua]
MDGLTLTTVTATSTAAVTKSIFPSVSVTFKKSFIKTSRRRELWVARKTKFIVFAAKEDESKLEPHDQMELNFGRMLGEDPKLTLAKIMARKANPDVSFLEVEKSFYKNKGKIVEIKELPFDVSDNKKPSNSLEGIAEQPASNSLEGIVKKPASNSLEGLNLVRPVPKGGVRFQVDEKPVSQEIKRPSKPVGRDVDNTKRTVPNVILRKPALFVEDDEEYKPSSKSKVRIMPNLTLKMLNDQDKKNFSDMTLLRKPEPMSAEEKQEPLGNAEIKVSNDATGLRTGKEEDENKYSGFTLVKKPEIAKSGLDESSETWGSSVSKDQEPEDDSRLGLQPLEKINGPEKEHSDDVLADSTTKFSIDATLQGKPERLDQSVMKMPKLVKEETSLLNPESNENAEELYSLPPISPAEDGDWSRAEDLLKTGNRGEVELVSASTRGFVVSFGSLVGFLPYRNLVTKWKFLAFESWLKQKGLDPSMYKQSLGIIGSYGVLNRNLSFDSSLTQEVSKNVGEVKSDMKLEDLLKIYDQEKLKFLTSFVGQKTKVNVVAIDRTLRKLTVSLRPKEKEELIERKRSLMAKLQVGDVVKCCIKKITYFGIFVEVEGVAALIHQTEVSWDATLDPASYFKVGQIVEAKVHQLDFTLERIFLSLKEITPDPLTEALESVVGDHDSLEGRLQVAEADSEWADVESLIKELQQVEGIQSVSKGRFFLSPGLAPTFQVYMASMFENQYKLLARSENKVQEVIVEASLDKEEMKSTILSCTSRVE